MNKELIISKLKEKGAFPIFGGSNKPIGIVFRMFESINHEMSSYYEEIRLFDWHPRSEEQLGSSGLHESIIAFEISNRGKRPSQIIVHYKTLGELLDNDEEIRAGFCYKTCSLYGIKLLRTQDIEENKFICI